MTKKIILAGALFLMLLQVQAGKGIDKYVKMLPQQRGMVYFIKPIDFISSQKGTSVNADFTYAYFNDSLQPHITMNFTVRFNDGIRKFHKVVLLQSGDIITQTDTLERFFSQPDGRFWENRYSAPLKTASLLSVFKQALTSSIDLYFDDKKVSLTIPKNLRKPLSLVATTIELSCQGGY